MSESSKATTLQHLKEFFDDKSEIDRLQTLIQQKTAPIVFDVVEPHGNMHFPQIFLKGYILKCLTDAGCKVILYIADWISFLHSMYTGSFVLSSIILSSPFIRTMWR